MITAQRRTTPSSRSCFVEFVLGQKLDGQIDEKVLQDTNGRVFAYNERMGLAELRFDEWLRMQWPDWKGQEKDTPEEFEGTHYCPECRRHGSSSAGTTSQSAFTANMTVDADACEDCGQTFIVKTGCG